MFRVPKFWKYEKTTLWSRFNDYLAENEIKSVADSDASLERVVGIHDEVILYKNNSALPVYRWGLEKGMYTDDVAEIIKGSIDRSRIATRGPTNVKNNTVFVVDTSQLSDRDDLKCDDVGA